MTFKIQTDEICQRNDGDIKDLLQHINNSIHLNSILSKDITDNLIKKIYREEGLNLQLLKTDLQISLEKYNNENDLNHDRTK